MRELVYQRATVAFALLVLITAVSFWLTVGHGAARLDASGVWTLVIILAFVKVRWVMLDFMELRSAPMKLRLLFESFAVAVATALIVFNWAPA
jgi:heme/copper-type cytochrome/quinol oxidase subunit 4